MFEPYRYYLEAEKKEASNPLKEFVKARTVRGCGFVTWCRVLVVEMMGEVRAVRFLCIGFCTTWWACAWHTTDFSAFASCEALDQWTSSHQNSYRHAIRGIDGESAENEYSYTCLRHMVVIAIPLRATLRESA